MRRVITLFATAILLSVSANAYSQFVDPNRRGVSDEILRLDQKNMESKAENNDKTEKPDKTIKSPFLDVPKKRQASDKTPKFEIKNDYEDVMKIEFVEVGYNKETERLSLVLRFTNKLSSRTVYVTRAMAEIDKIGEAPIETVCFSAPENKSVELVLPLKDKVDFQSFNTVSFDVPFLGFGHIKLYNVPVKWF